MSVTLGTDTESGNAVTIGDRERRSGLYLLGKSGMGKTTLIEQILIADVANGHGVFFLDPHGDAINSVIPRISRTPLVIDPEDEFYSFGINPLYCANVESEKERQAAYNRAYSVFRKIWAGDWTERPWLQLIIENTLYVFIENQAYTLAEVPLFFMNEEFRNHLLRNMKYNDEVVDFWTFEFSARSQRDQDAQVQAAFTRIRSLLSHPSIRRIIGQKHTTINFSKIIEQKQILFARLSAGLPEDQKRFIGIIILNELLHAVRKRIEIPEKKRHQFCIFVDEFQNFTSSEDFQTLFTEARKYGIASVIAHQERFGQFADNKKITGATAASVNKIAFQLTPHDAQELAIEFARRPPTEMRYERELVITQYPFYELIKGHKNPKIQEFVNTYLRRWQDRIEDLYGEIQGEQIKRMIAIDDLSITRIEERVAGIGRKLYTSDYAPQFEALRYSADAVAAVRQHTFHLLFLHERQQELRLAIRSLNRFLTALMEKRIQEGQEEFVHFLISCMQNFTFMSHHQEEALKIYISFTHGNPELPRAIPFSFAQRHRLFAPVTNVLESNTEEKNKKAVTLYIQQKWENFEADIKKGAAYLQENRLKKIADLQKELSAFSLSPSTTEKFDTSRKNLWREKSTHSCLGIRSILP